MKRSLLLFLLALGLLFVLPGCGAGRADDDDDTPDPADTDDDGDGLSENEGDCDDSDAAISPNESEATCDGVDNDCDPGTPDDIDADADGVLCSTDCDDEDAANFPGNIELCDGADNDCNGLDDMGVAGSGGQEVDNDGDGHSECQGDCDDTAAQNFPGNTEICDGVDNDCNGLDDMGLPGTGGQETDDDGDGQSECQGDCDDADAMSYPGALEGLLGSDRDCDGVAGGSGSLSLADYSFVAEDSFNFLGGSVSSAGDVDGDGLDDILVGATGNSEGAYEAGKAYLILGSSLVASPVIDLSLTDYSFVGENEDDHLGRVASAGDVDGDGLDDILVGATGNDEGTGKAYLILGSSLGASPTIDLSLADYSFVGENEDDRAGSVSSAGDVDGDGLDDLLLGASGSGYDAGKVYLILGSSLGASPVIDLSLADYSFVGENPQDLLGVSVSSAGDVDDDGLDDLLMGAIWNDEGGNRAGKAYLILGSSLGSSPVIGLSLADYSFLGENSHDSAGNVSSAGDVDGDGLDDILVGGPYNDDGGLTAGKAYLILGGSLPPAPSPVTIDLSLADYSFVGENWNDHAGGSVSSAGDVDGDGLDDLLVGAPKNDDGGDGAGKAYLVLGSSLPPASSPATISLSLASYSFVGENTDDSAGSCVSSAGDVDGDGLDDLLVGASENDDVGFWAGKAYLILSHL